MLKNGIYSLRLSRIVITCNSACLFDDTKKSSDNSPAYVSVCYNMSICFYNDTLYQPDAVIHFQHCGPFIRPLMSITAKITDMEKILGDLIAHISE